MERLLIQYTLLTVLMWNLLNFLHYYLSFLNSRLYKSLADFDSKFEVKYNKKYFLKLLLWLGFGTVYLLSYKQAFLQKAITANEYFAWVGGLYFCVIGYLLSDILSLGKYFVCQIKMSKISYFSFNTSMILYSFEFFGYSTLMLLSFLISKHPFLLGGTIGLAFDGILGIFQIKRWPNPAVSAKNYVEPGENISYK